MAGQAQRGSRDHGRSSRHGSAVALVAPASGAGPGSEAITAPNSPAPAATPAGPAPAPKAVWRQLQMQGLSPDEAANLTAFVYGLPTADLRWSLPQLNQLLFLRQMRQSGRFGCTDGGSTSEA